jgi:hypothetical protein
MGDIKETLVARDATHGDYAVQAFVAANLKSTMHNTDGWHRLSSEMRESLDMVAVKVSRILSGDPSFVDHWHDIAGYATLVEKSLASTG